MHESGSWAISSSLLVIYHHVIFIHWYCICIQQTKTIQNIAPQIQIEREVTITITTVLNMDTNLYFSSIFSSTNNAPDIFIFYLNQGFDLCWCCCATVTEKTPSADGCTRGLSYGAWTPAVVVEYFFMTHCLMVSLFCSSAIISISVVHVAVFLLPGEGIRCWVCSSDVDRRCGDPFNMTHLAVTDCDRDRAQSPYLQSIAVCRKNKQRGTPKHSLHNHKYSCQVLQ